ncbi:MAG: DUF1684 domain-containing protein [bacterium]
MTKIRLIFFSVLFLLTGCYDSDLDKVKIVNQIQKYRMEKDLSFKISVTSPIPDDHKKNFQGLNYFPIDLKYRFQAPLRLYHEKKTFKIVTSSGLQRDAQKYGYFEFEMKGKDCILQVYKLLDIQEKYPDYLFVPFMDATTGKESYPAGRYLDFQENDSGIYDLDFNLAYNPSCAYGKAGYNCPIPPAENRLEVAIKAGEKSYMKESH